MWPKQRHRNKRCFSHSAVTTWHGFVHCRGGNRRRPKQRDRNKAAGSDYCFVGHIFLGCILFDPFNRGLPQLGPQARFGFDFRLYDLAVLADGRVYKIKWQKGQSENPKLFDFPKTKGKPSVQRYSLLPKAQLNFGCLSTWDGLINLVIYGLGLINDNFFLNSWRHVVANQSNMFSFLYIMYIIGILFRHKCVEFVWMMDSDGVYLLFLDMWHYVLALILCLIEGQPFCESTWPYGP